MPLNRHVILSFSSKHGPDNWIGVPPRTVPKIGNIMRGTPEKITRL